jgi:hypothetical protein
VGSLALAAVASGAFSTFLLRGVTLDDVARITADQPVELARFVDRVNPDVLQQLLFDAVVVLPGCRPVRAASRERAPTSRCPFALAMPNPQSLDTRGPYATHIWERRGSP